MVRSIDHLKDPSNGNNIQIRVGEWRVCGQHIYVGVWLTCLLFLQGSTLAWWWQVWWDIKCPVMVCMVTRSTLRLPWRATARWGWRGVYTTILTLNDAPVLCVVLLWLIFSLSQSGDAHSAQQCHLWAPERKSLHFWEERHHYHQGEGSKTVTMATISTRLIAFTQPLCHVIICYLRKTWFQFNSVQSNPIQRTLIYPQQSN